MSMTPEERDAIVEYRLERSVKAMEEAEQLFSLGMYNVCANRLYYASFYATNALLISHSLVAGTHNGLRTMFQLNFVKTGIIDKEYAKTLSKNFSFRQQCDYDDFIDASKEDLEPMIPKTREFIEKIRDLIHKVNQ